MNTNTDPHAMWAKMKKNSDGLVPAITQDYENGQVLRSCPESH